jgi:hypothetical protein
VKTITIIATLVVDERNSNAPSAEDCRIAVENAVTTPDNDEFGIVSVSVVVGSEVAEPAAS